MPIIHLTLEMAPYLLLGFLFAGLMHGFIPKRFYGNYLAAPTFRSALTAAAIGVPLPLCSCGVIPTAMSLRRNGASKGATVSFLIATPQTGVDSILATWSLMGAPFAVIRPIAALVTSVFGGLMVNRFDRSSTGESSNDAEEKLKSGFWGKLKESLRYGYVDMMQDIGKWLVVGLLVAALITIFVPDGFFKTLGDSPLLNMLIVLAIALPMYVCATGSIPIAVALMLKGLTPGAALVFLMAGPAANMASIIVINKVLERRAMLLYIGSIMIGAIGFGLVIDYLLPASWFTPDVLTNVANPHCHVPLWKWISGATFLLLLAYALLKRGHHLHHQHKNLSEMETENNKIKLEIEGMSCNHCRASVERALSGISGVENVEVDLGSGSAVMQGRNIDRNAAVQAVNSLGFTCH